MSKDCYRKFSLLYKCNQNVQNRLNKKLLVQVLSSNLKKPHYFDLFLKPILFSMVMKTK